MDPTPDKEDHERKPPSRGSAAESSVERKFWGTDDEDELQSPGAEGPEDPSETNPEEDPLDEDLDRPEPERVASGPDPTPAPAAPAGDTPARRKISRSDAIWMGVLALILLILVLFTFKMFQSHIPTVGGPDDVDFPVKLGAVVIGDISTFWRRPDLEVDRVKLDAHLIPCAEITLKSGSGSGRLRLFFRNREGEVVGDPASLNFADGKFVESGKKKTVINATDGFKSEGEYNAYVAEQVNFWHLDVSEFTGDGPDSGRSKPDLRVRILPKRR